MRKIMRLCFGIVFVSWPFFGLAWLLGREFFIALALVAAIVVSIFGGVWLLTQDAEASAVRGDR